MRLSKRWLYILGACVLIGIIVGLVWLIASGRLSRQDPGKAQLNATLRQVGKLVILPGGEDPSLATVKDKNQLTDSFLKSKAQNGDKILIYYKAQKVYVYRPSANRIVDIGPVLLDAALSEVKGSRVAVRNGSRISDATGAVEDKIAKAYPEAVLVDSAPASRNDFPSTIVIDLTDDKLKTNFTNGLARVIGGQRGVLPQGEPKPDADILVVIGNDQR